MAHLYDVDGNEVTGDWPIYWSVNRTQEDTALVVELNSDSNVGNLKTFRAVNYGLEQIYASIAKNPNNSAIRGEVTVLVPKASASLTGTWGLFEATIRPQNSSASVHDSKRIRIEIAGSLPALVGDAYVYTAYVITDNGQVNVGPLTPNPVNEQVNISIDLGSDVNFAQDATGFRLTVERADNIPATYQEGTGIVLFEEYLPALVPGGALEIVRQLLHPTEGSVVQLRDALNPILYYNARIKNSVGDGDLVASYADSLSDVLTPLSEQFNQAVQLLEDLQNAEDRTDLMYSNALVADGLYRRSLDSLTVATSITEALQSTPTDTLLINRLDEVTSALETNLTEGFSNVQTMLTLSGVGHEDYSPQVQIIEMTRSNLNYTVSNVDSIPYVNNSNWEYVLWLGNNRIPSYLPVPNGDDYILDTGHYDGINTRETFTEPGESVSDYPDRHQFVYVTLQPATDLETFTGIVVAKGFLTYANISQ
ncbi:MAG: hypothetical protein D6675_16580 [Gemmatimonadetes bacterium]|nr:MAG: hypothetical protein D6675_16580 [Gemmatimonadota bacterium]